jgi:hypothetical protein
MLATPAAAQDAAEPSPFIDWQGDWDAALAQAQEQNKPIMVAFILRGESANEEVCRRHFKSPRIVEESRRFVCMLAAGGDARPDDQAAPSNPALEMRARTELMSSPTVSCPQFIFLMPDGKTTLVRHVWMLPEQELLKKMRLAYGFFDPERAGPEVRNHRDQVERLLEEAAGNNQDERRVALKTLARTDDPRVIEFLIKQTGPSSESTRRLEAIYFMRDKNNAKAIDCLHGLLNHRDTNTRFYAAIALEGIGMVESTPHLVHALKREGKERVRTHLVRAVASCAGDKGELKEAVLKLLKSTGKLDKIAALYVATACEPDDELKKAIVRAAGHSSANVRSAAYYAIGTLKIEEARKRLKSRKSSERGQTLSCLLWALAQLGEDPYEEEDDPATIVRNELPDNHLYDGDLEGPEDDNRNRPGGGRPGGGRSGGRGGGGRR